MGAARIVVASHAGTRFASYDGVPVIGTAGGTPVANGVFIDVRVPFGRSVPNGLGHGRPNGPHHLG